jgi:VanZ family protein
LTTNPRIRQRGVTFLGVICVAVLGIILTLGLWPFHVPKNGVAWLRNRSGLRFSRHGTVFSSGVLTMTTAQSEACGSLEIWLQPGRRWASHTFLTFYVPENPFQFSLHQSQADLALQTAIQDEYGTKTVSFRVPDVFRKRGPVFITINSGSQGTVVYIDGVPAKRAPQFRLFPKELTGRLVLGDSPKRGDSWSGQLLGLAIYHRELTAPQVLKHYAAWTQRERPEIAGDERNIALYLFDERGGNVVHNKAGPGADLYIPEKYVVLDQVFLERPWREFSRSMSYFRAFLKNIVGFIPLGFCFYAYLSAARYVKRPALATVILGTLVSLTIEVLQAYLPTRESGMTDLITNTFGTYIGVLLYRVVSPMLAATLPWLPLVASPRR